MTVYADVLRYRELFLNLFRRDFQAKYKGSLLGVVWSLLNPLALLAVYLVVFGLIWTGQKIPHYPLYLLAGLSCWIFLATSIQAAARSLIDSGDLIKKVRFPRQLVPMATVAAQAFTFVVMLAILIVISVVFVPAGRETVWLAIPLAALFACFVLGLGLVVACVNVLFRDVEHIIASALLPWFFLTPILWRFAELPARVQRHHALLWVLRWVNPVAPSVEAVRDAVWLGRAPRAADVVYLAVAAVTALLLGAVVFRAVDD